MSLCRGRLAPSPTGAQHIGNARTYLIAWLSARSQSGNLTLRMEDIDSPRVKPESMDSILEDFRWLGLDWDDGPFVQTQRLHLYESALEKLKEQELVYPCTCTRGDILEAASAPHLDREEAIYPGTCSHRLANDAAGLGDRPFAWRFRVTHSPNFVDGFRGFIQVDLKQHGGDFVVWKSSGTPAYQLAVVVDDAAMQITEVIRGDDLIPSTPRQLLLFQALGLQPPRFIHLPLVVGADGRRLAKRHGDTRLSALRNSGVTAERFLGLLAWSCGWQNEREDTTLKQLLSRFDLRTIPKEPFTITPEILSSIGYRTT